MDEDNYLMLVVDDEYKVKYGKKMLPFYEWTHICISFGTSMSISFEGDIVTKPLKYNIEFENVSYLLYMK